uniref:copper amine oxidase N-terminal domain-containing protein n=1 Tax=Paenibacillus periandrae TaxID=1761741 RepID=UPI001F09CFE5
CGERLYFSALFFSTFRCCWLLLHEPPSAHVHRLPCLNLSRIQDGVKLIKNGIDKTPSDNKPFIANGSTYVPLRAVSELLGANVTWDGDSNAVVIGDKVEGDPLPLPSNIVKNKEGEGYIKAAISSNEKMTINGKDYGTVGMKFMTKFINSAWAPVKLKATASYPLNAQYSSLLLSIGTDDEDAKKDETRTVTFSDQDSKILKQFSLSKGSVQEAVNINVKGVVTLNVEVSDIESGFYAQTINLVSPVLKK